MTFVRRLLLAIALVLWVLPSVSAQGAFVLSTAEGVSLCYRINADGETVTLTHPEKDWPYYGAGKPKGDIVVPATVVHEGKAYRVAAVGSYAFYGCDSVTSVSLPVGIVSIGTQAFNGCRSMKVIAMGRGLKAIGEGAFAYCAAMDSLVLPAAVDSIGMLAFSMCTGLQHVEMSEEQRRRCGSTVFYGCGRLGEGMEGSRRGEDNFLKKMDVKTDF